MTRRIVVLTAALAVLLLAVSAPHTQRVRACPLVTCEASAVCPEHDVRSTGTFKTKRVVERKGVCTYAEYKHQYFSGGKTKECKFWALCGCEDM